MYLSNASRQSTGSNLTGRASIEIVGLYCLLVAIFFTVLFCSGAYLFFYTRGITDFKPLYFYYLAIGLAGSAFVLLPSRTIRKLPPALVIWIWIYVCHSLFAYIYSSHSLVAHEALIRSWQAAALLTAFSIMYSAITNDKIIVVMLIFITAFAVCMNVVDFLNPTYSKVAGRAAGLYSDPNTSAYVLTLCMVLTITAIPRPLRILYCAIIGGAVLVTFSRSGWLVWTVAVSGLSLYKDLLFRNRVASISAVGILFLFLGIAFVSGTAFDTFIEAGGEQYLTENTMKRISAPGSGPIDASAGARISMIGKSLDEIKLRPLLGGGIGYTGLWMGIDRPHNMYLLSAVEGGLLGLTIYLSLLGLLWIRTDHIGKLAVLVIAIASNFSHNFLEDPKILCMLTIIAITCRSIATPDKGMLLSGNAHGVISRSQ